MKTTLGLILGMWVLFSAIAIAAEPASDLEPRVAVKLIALKANVPDTTIELPFIVDGALSDGKGFAATHTRRVAAIHVGRDANGALGRVLVFYDFLWNESLGWFMWESRQERAGEAVYIWSERKGAIVNR
ncbi:MAG TPA: hypothetical protein VFY13_04370 [Luteolibacter sp.]|nr:hypothetical protein [Luteolibacter sp.]